MNVGFLANRPTLDIPGDIYYGELPPKPRVSIDGEAPVNLTIDEINEFVLQGRNYTYLPSTSGIMHRSGELVGLSPNMAVWRFGFVAGSDSAEAFGCSTDSFIWVLATRRAGRIKEVVTGWALNLPASFQNVIDMPILITKG